MNATDTGTGPARGTGPTTDSGPNADSGPTTDSGPTADGGPASPPPGPPGTTAETPAPVPARRPRRLRSLIIGSAIAAVLAVVLFFGLGSSSGTGSGTGGVVGVGDHAPSFSLPSLSGGAPVDLGQIGAARHRPVVLNFFASWCIPCREETPRLAAAARTARAQHSPVQFVGVDVGDPHADAVGFVHASGIIYPVGVDTSLQVAAGLYGLDGEPNTFFVDPSGTVVGHVIGAVDQTALDHWLHVLTAGTG